MMTTRYLTGLTNNKNSTSTKTLANSSPDLPSSVYSEEDVDEKLGIISSLSSIGITVKEIASDSSGVPKCNTLISAKSVLKDTKNSFSNEILEKNVDSVIDYNGKSILKFSKDVNLLVSNDLFASSGGSNKNLDINTKSDAILSTLSSRVEFISRFEELNGSMIPIWESVENNKTTLNSGIFCRFMPDSSATPYLDAASSLNTKVLNQYVIAESKIPKSTPETQSVDKVRNLPENLFITADSQAVDILRDPDELREKSITFQREIVDLFKVLGYNNKYENDYNSTVFSRSLVVKQPQVVVSFGTDFDSKGLTITPQRTRIPEQITPRPVTPNPTGRFVTPPRTISEESVPTVIRQTETERSGFTVYDSQIGNISNPYFDKIEVSQAAISPTASTVNYRNSIRSVGTSMMQQPANPRGY
jgi:hypothetical protein